jgi:hypothetical protein
MVALANGALGLANLFFFPCAVPSRLVPKGMQPTLFDKLRRLALEGE